MAACIAEPGGTHVCGHSEANAIARHLIGPVNFQQHTNGKSISITQVYIDHASSIIAGYFLLIIDVLYWASNPSQR